MKQLLRCIASCLLAFTSSSLLAQPSYPLGPWQASSAPTSPVFSRYSSVQGPVDNAIWVIRKLDLGMQATNTQLVSSADNGLTWQFMYTAFGGWPDDFWAVNGQQAWALFNYSVNNTSSIYKTTTGATGFAAAPVQIPERLAYLRFFSTTTGVAVGQSATATGTWSLYRTTDAGASWQHLTSTPSFLAGTTLYGCAVASNNIWVTTSNMQVLHSADAGLTWSIGTAPVALYQPCFRDAQHGLAYATSSTRPSPLYSTVDGGATWNLVNSLGSRYSPGLAAVPGSAGTYITVGGTDYVTGAGQGTSITHNDGLSWQDLGSGGPQIDVAADQYGTAWAVSTYYGNLRRLPVSILSAKSALSADQLIYPNPSTGRVQLPAAGTYQQVAVFDMAGRHCRTVALGTTETTIDLSTYGTGIYVLRLMSGTATPQTQRLTVLP